MCYAQCCHGDGSGVRHVHMKYRTTIRLLCWQSPEAIQNFIVAMATVVMGNTCVQSIMAICTVRLL